MYIYIYKRLDPRKMLVNRPLYISFVVTLDERYDIVKNTINFCINKHSTCSDSVEI